MSTNRKTGRDSLQPKAFTEEIAKELGDGYAFTPFFGSGISAASGILMGQDFESFLAYTVHLVLEHKYDIRRSGWPRDPTPSEVKKVRRYFRRECLDIYDKYYPLGTAQINRESFIRKGKWEIPEGQSRHETFDPSFDLTRPLIPWFLCEGTWDGEVRLHARREQLGVGRQPEDPNRSKSSVSYIKELGIRSLFDWTLTLEFLASISVNDESMKDGELTPTNRLYIDEIDHHVIDSFNLHIVSNKQPNLIHNMIARLARSLNSQVFLTTNFDELVEASFKHLNEPITTFDVSFHGAMPNPATVRSRMSLVKLHGTLSETRADTSINSPATEADKAAFLSYLRGSKKSYLSAPDDFTPSHLLVMGYSARDARCVQMMKSALDHCADLRIFWIAHSERDRERIAKLFIDYEENMVFTVSQRTDLLLWELYQTVNYCLPGGGFTFQFTHNVPAGHFRRGTTPDETAGAPSDKLSVDDVRFIDEAPKKIATLLKREFENKLEIVESLKEVRKKKESSGESLALTISQCSTWDRNSGVANPAQKIFHRLVQSKAQAIWLELEDYTSFRHLLYQLFLILSIRRGAFQGEWIYLLGKEFWGGDESSVDLKQLEARAGRIFQIIGTVPDTVTLFLYGRNGPGVCAGLPIAKQKTVNRKKEVVLNRIAEPWKDLKEIETGKGLMSLGNLLANLGFSVVHMPHTEKRQKRNREKQVFIDLLESKEEIECDIQPDGSPGDEAIEKAKIWLEAARNSSLKSLEMISDITDGTPSDDDAKQLLKNEFESGFEGQIHAVFKKFLRMDVTRPSKNSWPDIRFTPDLKDENAKERILWLYAMTLFRQSRHSSAMISDAVFVETDRFRQQSLFGLFGNDGSHWDDDDSRWCKLFGVSSKKGGACACDKDLPNGWIAELAEMGLFLTKPGGYSWKYRDTRLGLQQLLETLGEIKHGGLSFTLKTMRSKLHYQIGVWYLRAYYSTGHFGPLCEAFYHFYDGFLHASEYETPHDAPKGAKTKKTTKELEQEELVEALTKSGKVRIAWRCIVGMETVMLLAPSCLRFWTPGMDVRKTFFKNFDSEMMMKCLNGIEQNHGDILEGFFEKSVETLEEQLGKLTHCVVGELGHHPPRPFGVGVTVAKPNTSDDIPDFSESIPDRATQLSDPSGGFFDDVEDAVKFNSEEFKQLVEAVKGNYTRAKGLDAQTIRNRGKRYLAATLDEALVSGGGGKEKIRDLLKANAVLLELCYLVVRRAKMEDYRRGVPFAGATQGSDASGASEVCPRFAEDIKPNPLWSVVMAICATIQEFCRYLPTVVIAEMHTQRIRSLSLYGLALGRTGRFKEAHRRLNESHALVGRARGLGSTDELAKVHMRRADVNLMEAQVKRVKLERAHLEKEEAEDAEKARKAEGEPNADEEKASLKRIEQVSQDFASSRRQFTAAIDRAWSDIERAEAALLGVSHSPLWWSRLATLKLTTYATIGAAKGIQSFNANYPRTRMCLPFRNRINLNEVLVGLAKKIDLHTGGCPYVRIQTVYTLHYASIILRNRLRERESYIEAMNAYFFHEENANIKKMKSGLGLGSVKPDRLVRLLEREKLRNGSISGLHQALLGSTAGTVPPPKRAGKKGANSSLTVDDYCGDIETLILL